MQEENIVGDDGGGEVSVQLLGGFQHRVQVAVPVFGDDLDLTAFRVLWFRVLVLGFRY